MHTSPHYRRQQVRIGRRARERVRRRYRVPALVLFCIGLMVSYFGHGPAAVTLAVLFGCAAVFLSNIDIQLRK